MLSIQEAEIFAKIAHHGQFRKAKDAENHPYMEHLHNVKNMVKRFGGSREDQVVALLHDVIEDCSDKGFDKRMIEQFFGKTVAERVDTLSNKKVDPDSGKPLSRSEWKARKQEIQVRMVSKMSAGDQLVKACDQIDNIADFVGLEPDSTIEYRRRYLAKGIAVIEACDKLPESVHKFARILKNKADYVLSMEDREEKGFVKVRHDFRKEWLASRGQQK